MWIVRYSCTPKAKTDLNISTEFPEVAGVTFLCLLITSWFVVNTPKSVAKENHVINRDHDFASVVGIGNNPAFKQFIDGI